MGCSPTCMKKITLSPSTMSSCSSAQLSQFAKEVIHFSSQYGGDGSMAYVAANLAGSPDVFPNYGDFTQACVFRTYGTWWERSPSSEGKFGKTGDFKGNDFIDLYYEEKVLPTAINIYETYHPGSVIQICGAEIEGPSDNGSPFSLSNHARWHVLWSGEAHDKHFQPQMFSPPIRNINAKTNLIRLVFDHRSSDYYTELDSVELIGMTSLQDEGTDLDDVYLHRLQELSLKEERSKGSYEYPVQALPTMDNGCFDMLPGELIQLIFRYLSLDDLCVAATTCTLFRKHCYDQLLYVELNLQPYWMMVSGDSLYGLTERCSQLQMLDLSWCGDWDKITSKDFNSFLFSCGSELKSLRLKACRFVTADSLEAIASVCTKLKELNLSSCRSLKPNSYGCLHSLKNLERLNLYRAKITEAEMIQIFSHTPHIRHLNLGGIRFIVTLDNVMQQLAKTCPHLESLDLWRAKTLSFVGLGHIAAGCPNLLELDVGWCSDLSVNTTWLRKLVCNCPRLKKLFLTSIRSIADCDLHSIASNLPDLEQLDLLGAQRVSQQGITRVLDKCSKLIFLDVSFCQQLTLDVVSQLREQYHHINIKKSFTISRPSATTRAISYHIPDGIRNVCNRPSLVVNIQ
ncbi:F-box/LRR-repeat protein 4-like isoform X1 [Lytechinus variegatus]|uniref:F-box/LRR-repeat protein 4-like isoform X1 n=1 Tax=Lytechinus variegatus TaxID=7654 RepID=UPI001BB28A04|nr:F-box/LRR-repeat protein 4-like isoform X1 [Lytechinus variegatus]